MGLGAEHGLNTDDLRFCSIAYPWIALLPNKWHSMGFCAWVSTPAGFLGLQAVETS
jgi:hypothetical protein